MGGLTGVFLASLGMDIHLTETYFIVHTSITLWSRHGKRLYGRFALLVAEITGRMYPESLGRLAAVILFIGFNLTFFPQFILAILGCLDAIMRIPGIPSVKCPLNRLPSILAIGYILPATYFLWSLKYGKIAGANPCGLPDWSGRSNHPLTDNFLEVPLVTEEAYDYDKIGDRVEVMG